MTPSQKCYDMIKKWEGLHDGNPRTSLIEPMFDPVGIPTIGWGCTSYKDGNPVKIGDKPITLQECEDLLKFHVDRTATAVSKLVKVTINQNQFDALVSFTYNVGVANLKASTLLKKLNDNCSLCAANEIQKWAYSHGKFLQGLLNRRFDEKKLFLS